jgi:hypothetical protein
MTTGFDIYRRGAVADYPEPGMGSLAAGPLRLPSAHRRTTGPITESSDHQITARLCIQLEDAITFIAVIALVM